MRRNIQLWMSLIGLFFFSCKTVPPPEHPPTAIKSIEAVTMISQLTGAASPNRTDLYGVMGTDLGSIFRHKDQLFFIFGDTFGQRPMDQIGAGGEDWRSNVLFYTSDFDPTDGIRFDGAITDSSGRATSLIPSPHNNLEITKIPTQGISVDGNIYLFFMSVKEWGAPGYWTANYSGVAKSQDDGQNFTILDNLRWPGESGYIQVAIAPYEDYLYFWTIPSSRFGPVSLMRVPPSRIEDFEAYEYYSGSRGKEPRWSSSMRDAVALVPGPVGELSVIWNQYLSRWIMTYLNEEEARIEIREAPEPWGPWSTALELVDGREYPGLYGAFLHPDLTSGSGRVIYFTMSLWAPYNVFLMRAEINRR
jgi:hypothetical protein